jgi:hypothetical protein
VSQLSRRVCFGLLVVASSGWLVSAALAGWLIVSRPASEPQLSPVSSPDVIDLRDGRYRVVAIRLSKDAKPFEVIVDPATAERLALHLSRP